MYLHIGKDYILNNNDIIGIFDINTLKKSNSYDYILENLSGKITDISGGKPKSLILINKNNKTNGYISNILSSTIGNRVNIKQ